MKIKGMALGLLMAGFASSLCAQDWGDSASHHHAGHRHQGAATHAPIGVMGDHMHNEGEFMFSYRYKFMDMNGNRDGSDDLSQADVHADFMIAPLDMTMDMHMFGFMWAPSDDLTLMAMLPYMSKEMDHVTRTGARFTAKSSGIGDLKLSALVRLWDYDFHHLHLNLGVSLPTGPINATDDTPAGANQPLPYPMQIGSGTTSVLPGLTYTGSHYDHSWGVQASGDVKLGRNAKDYAQGDAVALTTWYAYGVTPDLGISLRALWSVFDDYDGADLDLNPAMVPTADPDRRSGHRLDALVGAEYHFTVVNPADLRLAFEIGLPVAQSLDGPQLETDWYFVAGLQMSF